MKAKAADKQEIVISAPDKQISEFLIEGTAPLVFNRFSATAIRQIEWDMEHNTTKAAKKARRKARDFDAEARETVYQSAEGWYGFPVNGLKSALVRAGQMCGVEMTILKQALWVETDGVDAMEDWVQLVRLEGEVEYFRTPTRTKGVVNISAAGRLPAGWRANLRIAHEPSFISTQSVANLIQRAGENIGIGRGRQFSTSSVGMGWGSFRHAAQEVAAAAE